MCYFAQSYVLFLIFLSNFAFRMMRDFKTTLLAALLLAMVGINMASAFMPHHHHEGFICLEQSDMEPTHQSADDNQHFEKADLTLPKVGADFSAPTFDLLFLSAVILNLAGSPQSDVPLDFSEECPDRSVPDYFSSTQKLRGSPVFS